MTDDKSMKQTIHLKTVGMVLKEAKVDLHDLFIAPRCRRAAR